MSEYRIGDPVMDAAQGRAMVVVAAPDQTVAEWSESNNYDLQENYANSKFDPTPEEGVVECVYVSDVRSEPSKTYTFPVSRVKLIDAHHADDGRRLADRVAVQVLESVFDSMHTCEGLDAPTIETVANNIGDIDADVVDEARELADVNQRIGGDDD